ncbi:MAG: transketolase [Alphaproteobacteria bacterium]|nr:MAG: transketolase [Alphaproteobacteria bacterium]
MRNAFADEMTRICAANQRPVLLSGDIGNKLFDKLKAAAPDQFLNCGVAEANMIGVAAGLAMSGFRPFAYTIVPFITTRVLEQIRVDLCYHNVPATVVGVGGGLSYAALGPTHHALEDIAFLRVLPNMSVLCPGDALEVRACLKAAMLHDGPLYIRLGKKGEPVVHQSEPVVGIGGSLTVRRGSDCTILAVGNLLPEAMRAAELLAEQKVGTTVVSLVSVKPLDGEMLERNFASRNLVVSLEEHSVAGGAGSAILEWISDHNPSAMAKFMRIATPDAFYTQSGKQSYARQQLGLDSISVARKIADRLGRKLAA